MADDRANSLDADQVGRVLGDLSREHVATHHRNERDVVWAAVQARLRADRASRAVPRAGAPGWLRLRQLARRPVVWGLAAAALAVVVVVGVLGVPTPAYVVTPEGGATLRVPTREASRDRVLETRALETTVDFADQSRVTLRPHTTLGIRVEEAGVVSAWLGGGSIRVHVEHGAGTDYRFRAGAYEVKVVGTTFVLGYDPAAARLTLDLAEGRVIVRDESGGQREVLAGMRLELPERTEPEAIAAEPPATDPKVPEAEPDGPPVARRASKVRSPEIDFRSLARDGRYDEIVRAAEREGIARVLSTRAPAELQELAHAAHYTGRSSLAVKVFEDLSLRHGASSAGLRAPFFLGRIAEESGQSVRALSLYGEYLDRSPRGPYAAEALGRKMVLVQRVRGARAARPLAEQYVERFPKGSYHTLARSLLEGARSRAE